MTRKTLANRGDTERPDRLGRIFVGAAVVLLLGGLITFIAVDSATSEGSEALAVGPMGGPVLDVPMEASGVTSVGGVEVEGSILQMGIVPLDVTVIPTWTLVNRGNQPVDLGTPHASVLEGCCPGPLQLAARTLLPGESTQLSFPLQMHEGMDGPHFFAVHVPVGPGSDFLELQVLGQFGT